MKKLAFTMADRLSRFYTLIPSRFAFTMAEILLSLTIIGVVAAITLPSLMGNINERTWNTQRKALYARLNQAVFMMPQVSGYGQYAGTNTDGVVLASVDTAAETFLTEGLAKVLKINNICDSEHLKDCGIPDKFTNATNSSYDWPKKMSELNEQFTSALSYPTSVYLNPQNNIDTKVAAFETQNGESVAVYYNPQCLDGRETTEFIYPKNQYIQPFMCANFIYDLNGRKGPNTVTKDIGYITVLYPTEPSVVAPVPTRKLAAAGYFSQIAANCKAVDENARGANAEEIMAISFNRKLSAVADQGGGWSVSTQSINGTTYAWLLDMQTSTRSLRKADDYYHHIHCVSRY